MKQTIKDFLLKKRFFKKGIKVLKNKKGFSLMELLIVVTIMGVISAIAIPAYNKYGKDASQAGAKAEARIIYQAIMTCLASGKANTVCGGNDVDDTISKTCETTASKMGKPAQTGTADTDKGCYLQVVGSGDPKVCVLSNAGSGKIYCIDNSGNSSESMWCDPADGVCKAVTV